MGCGLCRFKRSSVRFRPRIVSNLPIYRLEVMGVGSFCHCTMSTDHFLGRARACVMHDGQILWSRIGVA